MGQEQSTDHGSVATMPEGPVLTEIVRLARIVDLNAPTGYSAHVLRIMRDSVAPWLTTAIFREWVPNSRIAAQAEEQEEQERRNRRITERTAEITAILTAAGTDREWYRCEPLQALFNRHGYRIEYRAETNAGYMARWEVLSRESIEPALDGLRAMVTGTAQPTLPGTESKPEPVEETDEGEDEDGCAHVDTVRCDDCGGTGCGGFDRWGDPRDCTSGCPHCDRCEASHSCESCGLDPDCSHSWRCSECDGYVTWERDHWEDA